MFLNGNQIANLALDSNGDAQASTAAFSSVGTALIDVTFSGNAQYASLTRSTALSIYANKVIVTAQTLTCSPYVVFAGQPASCTVHVPGGATGPVTFTLDGTTWSTASLDANGNATASGLTTTAAGPHVVQADYLGDSNFSSFTTSSALTFFSIKPQPSKMSVGCLPAQVTVGQSGTCKATLTGGATGSVDFYVHDTFLATGTLDADGVATASGAFASLPAGSYGVTAVYRGDNNFDQASAATTETVGSSVATPQVSLNCSPSSLTTGQQTTCTAQLPAGATGHVLFYVGGNYWTTVDLNTNSTATTAQGLYDLPAGYYSITAYYPGDQNFSGGGSGGLTVGINSWKNSPTVQVSCSPSALVSGNPANCTASVSGGATGAVLLWVDTTLASGLGLDAAGTAVFQNQLATSPVGSHTVQAAYQGDVNFAAVTSSSTVTVVSQKSNASIAPVINPTVVRQGGQFQVSGRVSGGATGYVDVIYAGTVIARLALDGSGSFVGAEHITQTPGDGSYTLTFAYSGDNNFNPATQDATFTVSTSGPSDPGPPAVPPSGPTSGTLIYSYSITDSSGTSGYAPTGDVVAFNDTVNGQWTAGYDSLNRIVSALQVAPTTSTTATPWLGPAQQSFCWQYDSFGNRMMQARSADTSTACDSSPGTNKRMTTAAYADPVNLNRITSASGELKGPNTNVATVQYTADASGNTTDDGVNQYLYDGDGRVCASMSKLTFSMTGYLYDAEGRRVGKGSLTSFSCDPSANGFALTTEYVLDHDGNPMTEFDGQGDWRRTDIRANGELIATYDSNGTHFHLNDWLGTRRVQTDVAGNPEVWYPGGVYGDLVTPESSSSSATNATNKYFTGKERVAETGLDYFDFRSYSSTMGRFISPDPSGLAFANPTNPQSLNLYSYALNNPLRFIDPNGLLLCDYGPSDTHSGSDFEDADNAMECTSNGGSVVQVSQTVDVKPPAPGTDLFYDVQVAQANQYLASHKVDGPDPDFGMKVIRGVGRQTKCIQDSLKKNGFGLALDAASLIPGEGSAAAGGQYLLSVVAAGNSAVNKDTTGRNLATTGMVINLVNGVAQMGAEEDARFGRALTQGELGALRIIPIAGTITSGVATAVDSLNEMAEIQACLSHP